jgi:hypothetical protein
MAAKVRATHKRGGEHLERSPRHQNSHPNAASYQSVVLSLGWAASNPTSFVAIQLSAATTNAY